MEGDPMPISGVQSISSILASQTTNLVNAASFDPADTNQDGIVSAAEALAYSLTHPEAAKTSANTTPVNAYSQSGAVNAVGNTAGSALNLLV